MLSSHRFGIVPGTQYIYITVQHIFKDMNTRPLSDDVTFCLFNIASPMSHQLTQPFAHESMSTQLFAYLILWSAGWYFINIHCKSLICCSDTVYERTQFEQGQNLSLSPCYAHNKWLLSEHKVWTWLLWLWRQLALCLSPLPLWKLPPLDSCSSEGPHARTAEAATM